MANGVPYTGNNLGLKFLDGKPVHQYDPEQILNRMLSTMSYLSTTKLSPVSEDQQAQATAGLRTSKQIGKGQCGVIWVLSGTMMVLKVPNENKIEELWNDCLMHKRIEEAFQQTFLKFRWDVNVPTFGGWIQPINTNFWCDKSQLFPQEFQPTYGLMSEMINPLPFPVREAIVDAFAPQIVKENKPAFLAQPENQDCLIRLYLGRRVQRSKNNTFRMRNFDLTVNEMEYLRLDTMVYAKVMARTLAILHWKAHVDADDVEFALGSAPEVRKGPLAAELEHLRYDDPQIYGQPLNLCKRTIGIWLLDFNQCRKFSENPTGIKQLERAFFFNDPYYPRPGMTNPKDQALWKCFKQTYLDTSAAFGGSIMPMRFIDAVELEGARRRSGGSLFQ